MVIDPEVMVGMIFEIKVDEFVNDVLTGMLILSDIENEERGYEMLMLLDMNRVIVFSFKVQIIGAVAVAVTVAVAVVVAVAVETFNADEITVIPVPFCVSVNIKVTGLDSVIIEKTV